LLLLGLAAINALASSGFLAGFFFDFQNPGPVF
jgi:hypothetical protein